MPVCAACGRDNPPPARFCMWCSSPLQDSFVQGRARKTVTVVFCDVVGSTPMADRFDPEAVRTVMTRFFERMRSVLEHHGGTVEKYIGDAVMAVFGIPTLHEDDAVRAVRAAAEMRLALAALNDELEGTVGLTIATRTGVNTGEVVVDESRTGPVIVGDAVNVAARLQQSAPPGGILLGRDTYALVRDVVRVGDASALVMKGKGAPVTAFPLLELTRGVRDITLRAEPSLVGRVEELGVLNSVFDETVRGRTCRVVVVVGDAGVGKSRLASEFVRALGADVVAVTGRCLPYGEGITFWPIAEVVWQLGGIDVDDPRDAALAKLSALLEGAEDAELLFERVAAVTGLAATTAAMQETFWAIRRLLEWAGRGRPLVLVVDDLQWAEPTLLDLVGYLVRSCREAPILLLCLARNDLLEEHPDRLTQLPFASTLHLAPFGDRETTQLIDDLLDGDRLDPGLRNRIAEAGGGNPLFVEEILQMLRDYDLLDTEVPVGATMTVPPTIHALLAARLDRLSPDERTVIRAAAVIGQVFWWGAVLDLVPDDGLLDVGSVLQALVRRDLIAPDRSAFVGEDAFRFHHLLIQETAYREIPKEVRADLHARSATWLETMAGDRIGEYEAILAYHHEQAARYLSELARSGDLVDAAIDRAHASLTSAGRRALSRGDMSAAANLLGRAHDVLDPADPRRLSIAPDLGQALMETGDLARAEDLLTEAVAADDPGLQAHSRIVLLLLKESTDPLHRSEEALEVLESVMPVFEELGDDLGLARSWRLLGDVHWTRAHYAEVDRALERAIEHARRSGAHWEEAESLRSYAGSGLYGPTPILDVVSRCGWIAAESAGDRAVEAGILRTLGAAQAMQGRIDEGRELVRRARQILEDLGLPLRAAFVSEAAGLVETLAGDDAAAERELRAGYEKIGQLGERGFLSTVAALLAHAIVAQGRLDEAATFCELAAETGAEDDITTQVLWRSARAKVLAARGELEPAEKLAREAVAIAGETDDVNMHADALMDLAQGLSASGQTAERREALGRAHELYTAKGNLVSAERAAHELASLEETPGEAGAGRIAGGDVPG